MTLASLLLLPLASAASPEVLFRQERSRLSMGCTWTIVAYGPEGPTLPRILEATLDEVDRIDRLMSHYRPESPLSLVNREGARRPVPVDRELFDFLALALQYSHETDGAFDVTVGPLLKAWGFFRGDPRVPGEQELAALRKRVGYRHVGLDPERRTVRFDREGVELDLGGIAKGYAVDRVLGRLQATGVEAALVNAGGSTFYGLGAPPGGTGWVVGIEDPTRAGTVAFEVSLRDRALSVSGIAHKTFEAGGRRYSHIMDPRTGQPATGLLSVAVLTRSGTAGDALDNAFFVAGVASTGTLLSRLPGTEVYLFPEGGPVIHLPE